MKKRWNGLKVACLVIVAAGAVVAQHGDARAVDGALGCWLGYNVCVDTCDRTYTAPGELHTCGTICASYYMTCIGYGPAPEIPGNYAD